MKENRTKTTPYHHLIGFMILVFLLGGQTLFGQSIEVNGVVMDQSGETIVGATVMEKGTQNGSITNVDGRFQLTVGSADAVLQVSFIGFVTQELALEGRTTISVAMREDVAALDEVVVVGYGAQRKESVVGAISQISSAELLRSPAANVT